MRKFKIILVNRDDLALTYHKTVEKISFSEAASAAYMIKHNLGHDWRILGVKEDLPRVTTEDSKTLGTVSLS